MEQTDLGRDAALSSETREVPIVIHARGASSVRITGDFTRWSAEGIRLLPGPDHEWGTTVSLTPGAHRYRLIIEGQLRG